MLGFGFGGKAKGLVSWKWEPRQLKEREALEQVDKGLKSLSRSQVIDSGRPGWGWRGRRSPESQSTSQGVVTIKPKGSRGVLGVAQALVGLQYSERSEGPEH